MPRVLINMYTNAFFGHCKFYNISSTIIAMESITKGFATDGEIHRMDLIANTCLDCEECQTEE